MAVPLYAIRDKYLAGSNPSTLHGRRGCKPRDSMATSPMSHSATEIPESEEDDDLCMVKPEAGADGALKAEGPSSISPGRRRKERGKRGRGAETISPSSPGGRKRDLEREEGDAPVSGRELRRLLENHLQSMTSTWTNVASSLGERLDKTEKNMLELNKAEKASASDRRQLNERMKKLEEKEAGTKAATTVLQKDVDDLKKEMRSCKSAAALPVKGSDPWAQYLQNRRPSGDTKPGPLASAGEELRGGDSLSEEDRRTLIVGGWQQDSKRQVILDESRGFLTRDDVQPHVDSTELVVWGPRRSFGALRFKPRAEESDASVRDRMWQVIRALRATPHPLQSTGAQGREPKNMWAQFVKTKDQRRRSSHCSLLRRVCVTTASEARAAGESFKAEAVDESKYELDWGSGSGWFEEWKIGSASHRAPNLESVKVLSTGWVDVQAVANVCGVTFDAALTAVERELNR